jgi:biotin--protein ligase
MFTIQLHIPLKTPLGQRIPLVQHLIATAVVMGIKNIPGYEVSEMQKAFLIYFN